MYHDDSSFHHCNGDGGGGNNDDGKLEIDIIWVIILVTVLIAVVAVVLHHISRNDRRNVTRLNLKKVMSLFTQSMMSIKLANKCSHTDFFLSYQR